MNISDVLPDGHFNGIEVLWLAFIGMGCWLTSVAARRHESISEPSVADEVDEAADEFFGPDAFAWPARSAHAPDPSC